MRNRIAIAAILPLAIVLAGCGSDSKNENEKFLSIEKANKELVEAQKTYTLPPGATWRVKFTDDSGSYEQGVPEAMALDEATCAWSRQWIKAHNEKDSKADTKALRTLKSFRTRKAYLNNDSSYHDLMESIQSKAALGDAGPITQYVQKNCNRS